MTTTMQAGRKVTFAVAGMSCGGCAESVRRALARHPGVASAGVNLALSCATVEFDPAATSPVALADAIRAAGYGAAPGDPVTGSADEG